jgi:hypothetical protein
VARSPRLKSLRQNSCYPLEELNRSVFAGLKFFLFDKFLLGPPQALVRNELHKFLDMDFFLSKVCRVQVQVQLMLLQ